MSGMKSRWIILAAGLLGAAAAWAESWQAVPPGSDFPGFDFGRREVTVDEFLVFLNETARPDFPETAQIHRMGPGRYGDRPGVSAQAVAEVTWAEADLYASWRAEKTGRQIRLPSSEEWEWAARGGLDGAPYPWGWGGDPRRMAQFDASGPADRGGRFPANGFGLEDIAGNLYEWCAPSETDPATSATACGGSWAERDPSVLDVSHRQEFEKSYRGRDVGFRLLREWEEETTE